MVHSLTGDSIRWVRGPVLRVVSFIIAVLHLQCDRVASRQFRRQVGTALSVSGQTGHNLPHRVLTSPGTHREQHNSTDGAAATQKTPISE